ncbi:MAG: hypothetical protein KGH72_02050 [Candidatus Micrarchaeota archaeon]|nr:hypothetical protein [Candidatus Micrarchaeota archaeon]
MVEQMNALVNRDDNISAVHEPPRRIEENVLKNVIRANWQTKLTGLEKLRSKQMAAELETHADNMRRILNSFDYEIFCIPTIIANSKHMARSEFTSYLNFVESIAFGYSKVMDKELVSMILIGMTQKAKSTDTLVKHFNRIVNDMDQKITYYNRLVDRDRRRLNFVTGRINARESSLFRIFFRSRIIKLKKSAYARALRIKKVEAKRNDYSYILERLKATPRLAKLPPVAPSES